MNDFIRFLALRQWDCVGQNNLVDPGFSRRSSAGPESTPWVAQAKTFTAPLSLMRAAALQMVPAVSRCRPPGRRSSPRRLRDVHDLAEVGHFVGPPLVHDGQVGFQAAGELPGPDHPSTLGGHHHQGTAGPASGDVLLEVASKKGHAREMVHGNVEKSLDLPAWRSAEMTLSAPAPVSRLAMSFAEMGSRGLVFLSWRA